MNKWVRCALLACVGAMMATPLYADSEKDRPRFEVRKAETDPAKELTEAKVGDSDRKVYLHKKVELTNEDIKDAKSSCGDDGVPKLELTLTEAGGKKLANVTEAHKGKPLAILIDGKVVMAPTAKDKVSDKVVITGAFTEAEAAKLAQGIAGK